MHTAVKHLALLVVLLTPATVFAQGSLTGTVRDASGGVLPGVTVEASSPALIEKVRTAVTDDNGQYRIVDLRPGTYTLTFSLDGFNAVRREGIQDAAGQLQGSFRRQVRVGDAGNIYGPSRDLGRVAGRQLDCVALGQEPPAPVLLGPAVLRQEHRVAIGATKRAADVRVARPVESAAANEPSRRAEDRFGGDQFHGN